MTSTATALLQQASDLLAEVVAMPSESWSDAQLCAIASDAEATGRMLDAVRVTVAGEIGERSRPELSNVGLSARLGAGRAANLLEQLTRVSQAEASRRIRLGTVLRQRATLQGEPLPALRPHVAEAVRAGTLGLDAANLIVGNLSQAERNLADPRDIEVAEQELAAQGARDCADLVGVAARAWRAAIDPDGAEPREEELRARRGFTLGRERDGMTPFWGACDPVSAAQLKAAFAESTAPDAAPRFLSAQDADAEVCHTPDGVIVDHVRDPRTREQRQLDVLLGLVTAGVRSTGLGSTATVLVNVSLEDFESGRGAGWLDDVAEPVSAQTVRELACDSGVAAVLFGTHGEVLALGRKRRSFSAAQRRALASRDGGCVWPRCTAPPTWCHAHHVTEWSRGGGTDIDNGALLCAAHHHLLHASEFTMKMINGRPRLLAPAWIDPDRRCRPSDNPASAQSAAVENLSRSGSAHHHRVIG